MLLIPDDNGKIIKSIEYFNTVSPPVLRHFLRLKDRWRYIPDLNSVISVKSIVGQESHLIKWYVSSLFLLFPYIYADWQLFFDDEHRNFEVESLGVTMCLVEARGTDLKLFNDGLGLWRKRRGIKVEKD